jgi:uncharacterized alkaline shock family protein YloU
MGRPQGTTTIAPTVLITVTRLSVLGVTGVAGFAPVPGGVNRLFRRGINEGIRVEVTDSTVALELYLTLLPDTNVLDVAHRVRREVARAIQETVGMQISRIDVHIEDVDYSAAVP